MHALKSSVSEAQYLDFENGSPERHEYVAGEIYALTGATLRHAAITLNLAAVIKAHLKGTPCRTFMTDVKLRVARDQAYYYPDLLVTCDPRHAELTADQRMVEAPLLVIEVLSESTEGIDRREKLHSYRKLATLKEYVLVSQRERAVEVHRRSGEVGWERFLYEPGDTVELRSIELALPMADVYDDTGV